jgi:poly-beta-1,6-N-acetyl-D-glucosamine synthase
MTGVIIVFGVYYLVLVMLLIGWRKARERDLPEHHQHLRISVIIPFRNEEKNITSIIRNLIIQSYNHEYFEVMLCDDHSSDASSERATAAITGLSNFTIVRCIQNGKKEALALGISLASGEVIVTTDADCAVPENWLARINHAFQDNSVKMAFGGVVMRRSATFFSGLQAMEFSSLVGSAGATAGLGYPILCNGANLAFLKSTFEEVKGYDGNLSIPSGDDEFLLRKIIRKYPNGICFLNTEDSVVSTDPQTSLSEFISQRIRWASKWRYNASIVSKATAIFVLLFQLFFAGLIIASMLDFSLVRTALPVIAIKLLLEFIFIFQCSNFLGLRWRTFVFLTLQFLYPFYVIFIGIASNFMPYEWKGRKWKHL